MRDDIFCAERSVEAEEGLFGSAAAETSVWLVLEYDGVWAPKPLGPSELPAAVKKRIGQWLEQVPGSRLQFIRKGGGSRDRSLTFMIGCSREHDPWLLEMRFERYEELLELDLKQVLQDGAAEGARRIHEPVHLVCTHGKRDRCCAKWGVPLYQDFERVDAPHSWQTTHLGGHRFAANVVMLPHGLSYGRVTPGDAESMIAAHRDGRLYGLDKLRGRTCYDRPAQAGEYFLRQQTGDRTVEGMTHRGTEALGGDRYRVRFATADGSEHALDVVEERTGASRPSSCGDEPESATRYRLA
jgi:hypothetical protein